MAEQQTRTFMANDAIAYVDAYRRWLLEQPSAISTAKDKYQNELYDMEVVSSRNWAELRAMEHALHYKVKKEEPGLVVLGDKPPEDSTGETMSPQLKKALEEKDSLEEQNRALVRQLRAANERQIELQGEVVQREQQAKRAERKLSQAYSTFTVSGVTGVIVLLLLFGLLFFRG